MGEQGMGTTQWVWMEATQSLSACKTEMTFCFGNYTLILKALCPHGLFGVWMGFSPHCIELPFDPFFQEMWLTWS